MGFVSARGLTATDEYANTGRIILSHPSAAHALILAEVVDESGYGPSTQGFKTANGRTPRGQITINGGGFSRLAQDINCSFLAKPWQVQYFEVLKGLQDSTTTPITVSNYIEKVVAIAGAATPNWLPGFPTTGEIGIDEGYAAFTAFVNTDAAYKSTNQGTNYWLLQFQLLAEV
jgi:hypothetical protein